MRNESTLLTSAFVILLLIQAIMELVIGFMFLANFQMVVETGFDRTYTPDMDIFGIVIGLQLMLLSILLILATRWTLNDVKAGPVVGIAAGAYFLVFGIFAFIKFGDVQAIMVDSIRGLLTVIMGYWVLRLSNRE